jgi:hypothetical protein
LRYVLLITILIGCATREEGPAEKIGRGFDQIIEGMRDVAPTHTDRVPSNDRDLPTQPELSYCEKYPAACR